jgi:seryl-tRNA synthetase
MALARTVLCLMEHYQLEDGGIEISEVLRPYMGGRERIG